MRTADAAGQVTAYSQTVVGGYKQVLHDGVVAKGLVGWDGVHREPSQRSLLPQ
jgi:hypothetical protein